MLYVGSGCQGIPGGGMDTEHLGLSMTEIAIVTRPDAGAPPGKIYNYHGDGSDSSTGSLADQARISEGSLYERPSLS